MEKEFRLEELNKKASDSKFIIVLNLLIFSHEE